MVHPVPIWVMVGVGQAAGWYSLMSPSQTEPPRECCVLKPLRGLSHVKEIRSVSGGVERARGVHHESLRVWIRRAETDAGFRPGLTSDERARLKELERENRELRRANEILKSASIFFATELDGRTRK